MRNIFTLDTLMGTRPNDTGTVQVSTYTRRWYEHFNKMEPTEGYKQSDATIGYVHMRQVSQACVRFTLCRRMAEVRVVSVSLWRNKCVKRRRYNKLGNWLSICKSWWYSYRWSPLPLLLQSTPTHWTCQPQWLTGTGEPVQHHQQDSWESWYWVHGIHDI